MQPPIMHLTLPSFAAEGDALERHHARLALLGHQTEQFGQNPEPVLGIEREFVLGVILLKSSEQFTKRALNC